MKWFYNLKIGTKLISSFIIVALISVVIGVMGINNMNSISKAGYRVVEENTVPLDYIDSVATLLQRTRVNLRNILLDTDANSDQGYLDKINEYDSSIDENMNKYEKMISIDEERGIFNNLKSAIEKYKPIRDKVVNMGMNGQAAEAFKVMINEGDPVARDIDAAVQTLFKLNLDQAKSRADKNAATASRSVIIMAAIIAAGLALAIGLGLFISRIIGKPVRKMVEAATSIAGGDLSIDIDVDTKDELGSLAQSFKKIVETLRKLLLEVDMLTHAALDGKLDTRGNADKFMGGYKEIVEGINSVLKAVVEPVNEAASVLKEMSNGNLQMRVKGDYKGDHAEIKNALNDTLDALSSYVKEISDVLGEMANSNLNVGINNEYKGDFAQIKEALNLILDTFNEVLGEMGNAADQVASGSRQVSDGSQALSQGATEQASSIEELTASITEIAAQTKQNAVNASQANDLALKAKNNAEQGNKHMKEMLNSMDDINESSANISKIIKVIDEIAFQTNILALNAAVEAARAGQHGKGFAVVAEEVRNLAARSANAAKETTDLIEGSIKNVEQGTKIARDTAADLDEIVEGVSRAANLVSEIATASNDQATGIAQINKGVEQVSQVIQTNSATAEEGAAASEELSSQAEVLKDMVGRFRLKNTVTGSLKNKFSGQDEFYPDDRMKTGRGKAAYLARTEAAAGSHKPKIALSDMEFGKY